jgi:hypothetical protein
VAHGRGGGMSAAGPSPPYPGRPLPGCSGLDRAVFPALIGKNMPVPTTMAAKGSRLRPALRRQWPAGHTRGKKASTSWRPLFGRCSMLKTAEGVASSSWPKTRTPRFCRRVAERHLSSQGEIEVGGKFERCRSGQPAADRCVVSLARTPVVRTATAERRVVWGRGWGTGLGCS